MYETAERLKKFPSPTPSHWRENAKSRITNQETRRKARKVAMKILNAMENKGINDIALSALLGITNAELAPLLKGRELPSCDIAQAIESILDITL